MKVRVELKHLSASLNVSTLYQFQAHATWCFECQQPSIYHAQMHMPMNITDFCMMRAVQQSSGSSNLNLDIIIKTASTVCSSGARLIVEGAPSNAPMLPIYGPLLLHVGCSAHNSCTECGAVDMLMCTSRTGYMGASGAYCCCRKTVL